MPDRDVLRHEHFDVVIVAGFRQSEARCEIASPPNRRRPGQEPNGTRSDAAAGFGAALILSALDRVDVTSAINEFVVRCPDSLYRDNWLDRDPSTLLGKIDERTSRIAGIRPGA
jgi:hypothetical protein